MGQSRYGKEVNSYNGLTDTLAANILRTRKAGKVVKSGRLVSMGAYLGADTSAVANARLAAHLINPGTLDPATLLAESDRHGITTLWNGNGAGGAVFELPVAIPWHLEELGDWNLWLQSYYQGAATGTIPDATALSSWPQVGGIGPLPAQATAANKPILKLAQQNGLDVVRFDGVNDYLLDTTTLLPPMAQPYSWAVVWKPGNIAAIQVAIQSFVGSPVLMRDAAGLQSMHAGTYLNQAMPGGAWAISIAVFNGVNSINMLNGVPVVGDAGSAAIASGNIYFGSNSGVTVFLNGDIGEIFMDNRAWSMLECQLITQRLAWIWGLTASLPAGFPYKTLPYLINGGKLVNAGDDIAVGVHSDGTLRMPANFFLGGHKWEQSTSGLVAPSPMVPTTDTDDDKGLSTYFVVEDNRPPVLTPVNAIDGAIMPMGVVDYKFTAADPDRSDGYGDYIKKAIVRVWQRFRGAMYYDSHRTAIFTKPQYDDRGAQSLTVSSGLMTPPTDFGTRMFTRLAAWNNPVQTDNTVLTTWVDTSGNVNNATQATVGNKPKYRTASGLGSLPAIDFDGTDDRMDLPGISASSTDEAIFALIKLDALVSYRTIVGPSADGGRHFSVNPSGGLTLSAQGGAGVSTVATLSAGSWAIVSAVRNGSVVRLGINGTVENFYLPGSLTASLTSTIGASLGASGAFPLDGMIEDVIIMKASELRPGDQERFVGYMAHAYIGTSILPATHFYKTSLPGLRVSPPTPNTNNTTRLEGIPASNANGDVITQWSDTGPSNSNHATQVTAANKPIWRDPVINGLGAADFDGVNDYLTSSTITGSSYDDTVFALVKLRAYATSGNVVRGTSGSGGLIDYIGLNGDQLAAGSYGVAAVASSGLPIVKLNEWTIVHWSMTATTFEFGVNGVVYRASHAMAAPTAARTTWWGNDYDLAIGNQFNGLIAKIVRIPTSELGIDGTARWVGKIAHEYGLESLLPDSHPYRFEEPGADIEHAWTVEAQDEIGGESGTGTYGYDGELPDTTKMNFYTSGTGYSVDASGVTVPNVANPFTASAKTSRRTLASFTALYLHPTNISSLAIRFRIVKKDASGEYQQDQITNWFFVTIANGGSFTYYWWRTLFEPLDFGFDYGVEVQYIDKNGITSQWRGRNAFHTNYPPNQGSITSPTNPTTVTSPPLALFSVVDDDDVGVAYYAKPEWAIWEMEVGATGAGTSPPQFSAPYQLAVTPTGSATAGNVNVADNANGRVMILDANLGFIGVINDPAVGVRGVAADPSGNIYTADTANSYLKKYSAIGTLLLTSTVLPTLPGWGQRQPYHLAMLRTSPLRVSFSIPNSINGFSSVPISTMAPGGGIWQTIDGKGDNRNISVIGIAFGDTNLSEFWAADYIDAYIKLYSDTLVLKDKWGDFDRIVKPVAIQIHPDTGNVWITDEYRKTIMEYTRYGEFLGEVGPVFIGTGGTGTNMSWAYGLAFNLLGDKFYVTDSLQNKVRRFRVSDVAEKTNTGCAGEIAIKGPYSILNQSFEDGSSSWGFTNGGTFTVTSALASTSPAEGNNYYHSNFTAGPTKPNSTDPSLAGSNFHNNDHFPVVEGFSYQISAKFRRDKVGMFGQVGIVWLHETTPSIGLSTSWSNIARPTLNAWTEIKVSDTAPPGATSASVLLYQGVDVVGLTYPINIDWDDIQIEDGVRYLRGASFISDDDYSYQLTGTDMPVKSTYTLMARGRDGDNPGPWSDVATIYYVAGPTATVISPTPGQVFTTATPIFLWQLTAGEQWAYKVEVLDTNGIIVYTSDWIQSINARSHQVPVSAGLVDGGSYIGRLWIDDGNLQVLV